MWVEQWTHQMLWDESWSPLISTVTRKSKWTKLLLDKFWSLFLHGGKCPGPEAAKLKWWCFLHRTSLFGSCFHVGLILCQPLSELPPSQPRSSAAFQNALVPPVVIWVQSVEVETKHVNWNIIWASSPVMFHINVSEMIYLLKTCFVWLWVWLFLCDVTDSL